MSVEVVLKNVTTTTGEGPHWDDASQSLLFVDILNGGIHRWCPSTGKGEKIKLDGTVGFVVPARKGGYIAGLDQSVVHVDWESQKVTKLNTVDQGRDTRFNDGKCDPAGRVWAGTMAIEKTKATRQQLFQGALYTMNIDGSLWKKAENISVSNDLAWTADKRNMFYIDSVPRKVFKYDYNMATGAIRTMGKEKAPTVLDLNQGNLYTLEVDGSIETRVKDVSISNGLAWTADNRTMYYIDSIPRKVFKYDYDITTGAATNQKVAVDFGGKETIPSMGFPDGMTIDTEGKLWVACYNVGKVIRFDPETGKELRTVKFEGAKKTTSCCFGGKNLDELYVTCGTFSLTEEEIKNEQPLAGSVFRVTGLGVKGTPACVYEG